ncbi:MAG: DUF2029 domain-containing protein [Phycisphaerales bacterium]|nr:DUF2029 domain-containing protein [Phycisphaerales bacterium]
MNDQSTPQPSQETPGASPWWSSIHTRRIAHAITFGIILWGAISCYRMMTSDRVLDERFRDFYEFFDAADSLANGRDVFKAGKMGYIYPPMLVTLMLPFARLGIETSGIIWMLINTAFFASSAWLGGRAVTRLLGLSMHAAPVITAIGTIVLADKILSDFKMQQVNSAMLFAWVVGLWGLARMSDGTNPALPASHPPSAIRHPTFFIALAVGLALGSSINLKYLALITLPYFLLRGHWKLALGIVLGTLFWALLPALFIGWEKMAFLWRGALAGLVQATDASGVRVEGKARLMNARTFGISITTACVRVADGMSKPILGPIFAGLLLLVTYALTQVIYAAFRQPMWIARFGRRELSRPHLMLVEFVGLITIAMAFSPQTNARFIVQMLPLAFLLAGTIIGARTPRARWLGLAGLAVMWFGIIFPPASEATRELRQWWQEVAGLCSCLVIAWLLGVAAVFESTPTQRAATP